MTLDTITHLLALAPGLESEVQCNNAKLQRDAGVHTGAGLGTGNLRELYDPIAARGGRFYLSGMSGKARGLTEADIQAKPAEFTMPNILVRLSLESDRMFTY